MYAYCANNPVMYTDITGYAAESNNIAALISVCFISVMAITIGVIALSTSFISMPALVATLLITGGGSVLLDLIAIGRAQYNYSEKQGQKSDKIWDDVINAVGNNSWDRLIYHTATRVGTQLGVEAAYSLGALAFQLRNLDSIVSYGGIRSKVSIISFIALGIRTAKTTYTFFDDNYAFDYAYYNLGWEPWE
jgi:hypothetical protein